MAKPRVFVSSTFYDLKYVRSSLEIFIRSLGYDPILSEKGDIAYTPEVPLDESCYREAQNSDIYVLIIGGRYGSEVSEDKAPGKKEFFDRYQSITKQEYKSAADKNIPVYVLIEKNVYAEYGTFRKNRSNKAVEYAHVDSVNIFYFIEEVLAQPRNNPVRAFDDHADIEIWLREQWAGLFRELIQRMSGQQQLASLSSQVSELAELNTTLKNYMEALLTSDAPEKSSDIISTESKRLAEARQISQLRDNPLVSFLMTYNAKIESIAEALNNTTSLEEFINEGVKDNHSTGFDRETVLRLAELERAHDDWNKARGTLGLPPIPVKAPTAKKAKRD